tara:strand:- start:1689 stop:3098 length:1410 start_codon:yes stop_codon:yes gene_type:complete
MIIKRNDLKEIILFSIISSLFSLGMQVSFSWRVGWTVLTLISISLLVSYINQLTNKKIIYDKFLFLLGIFVFIMFEPFIFLFQGLDFPFVDDRLISDNFIANKTGLIVSLYALFFYVGRIIAFKFIRPKPIKSYQANSKIGLISISLFIIMAISPFFISGTESLIDNFLINIAGRSTGNIGFSSVSLGASNFIIVLLGASILPTIILVGIYAMDKNIFLKILFSSICIILFILYASLGGRSGVILVFITLMILWHVKSKKRFPIFRFTIFSLLGLFILLYQINYRDDGFVDDEMNMSALTGYELNRELAFIVSHYGENEDFISTQNIISSSIFPLIDTFILFVTNPIPRAVWSNKPIDESFAPYNTLRTGLTGFEGTSNITPTIPGRYYMKYGVIGVMQAGILIGILWFWANIYILKYSSSGLLKLLIPVFAVSLLFICTRDFTAGRIYPLLFLILFVYLNKIRITKIN